LCMQHSLAAAALSTSFLMNHAPNLFDYMKGIGIQHRQCAVVSQKD